MTIGEYHKNLIGTLRDAGVPCPENEGEQILLAAAHKDRLWLFLHGKDPADSFFAAAEKLKQERLTGRPLQYILGEAWFMGLPFYVDESVLIPRQDTELTAETAEEWLCGRIAKERKADLSKSKEAIRQAVWDAAVLAHPQKKRGCTEDAEPAALDCGVLPLTAEKKNCAAEAGLAALDLCTGSGALAVFLKHRFPDLSVTAGDISEKALAAARKNAKKNGVFSEKDAKSSVHFVHSDLFAQIPQAFDLIVTNPPYIPAEEIPKLMREVREHEPRLALDGGKDGLQLIRTILREAPAHLKEKGLLLMEIGSEQGAAVLQLAKQTGAYKALSIRKDLNGLDRMLYAEKK